MKRGLKDLLHLSRSVVVRQGYNRYPDEKGTERYKTRYKQAAQVCYNRYPDEKGTESLLSQSMRSVRIAFSLPLQPLPR